MDQGPDEGSRAGLLRTSRDRAREATLRARDRDSHVRPRLTRETALRARDESFCARPRRTRGTIASGSDERRSKVQRGDREGRGDGRDGRSRGRRAPCRSREVSQPFSRSKATDRASSERRWGQSGPTRFVPGCLFFVVERDVELRFALCSCALRVRRDPPLNAGRLAHLGACGLCRSGADERRCADAPRTRDEAVHACGSRTIRAERALATAPTERTQSSTSRARAGVRG